MRTGWSPNSVHTLKSVGANRSPSKRVMDGMACWELLEFLIPTSYISGPNIVYGSEYQLMQSILL